MREGVVQMNGKLQDKNFDFLFQAVLTLKTPEECSKFFDDLCTVPELKAMSQRLAVARMLSQKQVYSDIVAETGASTATISRVNRSLNYGSDGYELVFQRIDEADKDGE
jgi:TrpR-related protein YerC/YecD